VIAAIDFGASATKAAVYEGSGAAAPVMIDNAPESSSSVFLQPNGELICGVAAENSARRRPARMQASLKRRINRSDVIEPIHQEIDFGAAGQKPLVRCVATVIGHAREAIASQTGSDSFSLLLTHPVGWREPQRAALLEAARVAGVRPDGMLSEAEAVGWHVRATHQPAGPLLVVDLGASTLDIALLDVGTPDAIKVIYSDGDDNIGGDDFDGEVLELVREYLSDDPVDAALLDQFIQLCEVLPHVAAREAERTKRALAAEGSAIFAHKDIEVELSWDEFAESTGHLVERIFGRVRHAIESGASQPGSMVVSGGAVRLPSIHEKLAGLASEAGFKLLGWEADGLAGSATTAAALGAARRARPWSGTKPRARRPVSLQAGVMSAGSQHVIAVPDGVVVNRPPATRHGLETLVRKRLADPNGTTLVKMPAGIAQLGYDSFADRLVTASRTKTISTWQINGTDSASLYGTWWKSYPSLKPGHIGDDTVTAIAARGSLVAWTESCWPGTIVDRHWFSFKPGFAVQWLGFTSVPHLLVVGADELVLVDPVMAAALDTIALPASQPAASVALASESTLVFTAAGRDLTCYETAETRFTQVWTRDDFAVPAIAAIRLDGRPALVVFDGTNQVYRALDARTGEQLALKDARPTSPPSELLADGNTGIAYPRHGDGAISVLTFAEARS